MKIELDPVEPTPVRHGVGDELGAVVEAHERRCPSLEEQAVQGGHDLVGVDGAVDHDGGALPGELVDDVEQLQGAAIHGGVELEVERPQGVRSDGAHGPDRRPDAPQGLLSLAIGHLQSLLTPQALDALVVDAPALGSGLGGGSAPAPPGSARPRRRVTTPAGPSRPRMGNRWIESIGGAVLADDPTRSSLGDPEPLAQHLRLPRGDGSGSEVSLSQLLEHRLVELRLGQELLEPDVLTLELFEALGVAGLHAAVLGHPAVPGGVGDLEMSTHFVESGATGQELVAFGELADDLVGCVPPSWSWCLSSSLHFGASDTHKLWTTTGGSPHYWAPWC